MWFLNSRLKRDVAALENDKDALWRQIGSLASELSDMRAAMTQHGAFIEMVRQERYDQSIRDELCDELVGDLERRLADGDFEEEPIKRGGRCT